MIGRRELFVLAAGSLAHRGLGADNTAKRDFVSICDPPFNARGDGISDDSLAIQAALDTGRNVFVPAARSFYRISAQLELRKVGQSVVGEGVRSKIVQYGEEASSSVLRALDLGHNHFRSLSVVPGTVTDSLSYGYGIVICRSSRSIVEECTVTGHRRGGIALFDSDDCSVRANHIGSAVVRPGPGVTQSSTGVDIYLAGRSSRNVIEGNSCVAGAGVGIAVQTLAAGDVANGNVILNNTVASQHLYGIMLYILHREDSLRGTRIAHNVIDGVSGDIPEDSGRFNYGAGIYVQSAEGAVIEHNIIRNTVTRSAAGKQPFLNNVPAAIGVSGVSDCLIRNNIIDNAYFWGIAVIQASVATHVTTGIVIERNRGTGLHRSGVYLLDVVRGILTDNDFHAAAPGIGQGILIRQAALDQSQAFDISRNKLVGFGVGVEIDGSSIGAATVRDNQVIGNTGYSYAVSARHIVVERNTALGGRGGRGILIRNTARSGTISENVVAGCEQAIEPAAISEGIRRERNVASRSRCR